jgi:Tfp pilus assembly protein PilX
MYEKKEIRRNESGSIMVIALMMLAILTLIGVTAARNSTVELKMAENDAAYRQALYNADSGVSFALRLSEADVEDLMPGDLIPATPDNARFQLMQGSNFNI